MSQSFDREIMIDETANPISDRHYMHRVIFNKLTASRLVSQLSNMDAQKRSGEAI